MKIASLLAAASSLALAVHSALGATLPTPLPTPAQIGAVPVGGDVGGLTVGGAPLSAILGATQSIDLDFVQGAYQVGFAGRKHFASLSSMLIVSGDTNRTYIGADGKMRYAAPNAPRISYDLATGARLGLLVEPAASNLLTYSYAMTSSNGFFANGQAALSSDIAPLLSGAGVAKHTRSNSGDDVVGYFYANSPAASAPYAESVYVYIPSSSTVTSLTLEPAGGAQTATTVAADLTKRDQWQRLTTTTLTTSSPPTRLQPRIHLSPIGAIAYSTGWQVEQGQSATSYIASNASIVTRAAEGIALSPTATQYLDPTQPYTVTWGGLVRSFGLNASVEQGGVTVSDTAGLNSINLQVKGASTPALLAITVAGGTAQASLASGLAAANVPFEMSAAFAANDVESYVRNDGSGTDVTTTTAAQPVDLAQVNFDAAGPVIHRRLSITSTRVASTLIPSLPGSASVSFLSANPNAPGTTIPIDFLGWSIEFNSGGLSSGVLTPSNTGLINLWRTVTGGAAKGTLRIGGASQDTNTATSYVPPTISATTLTNLKGFLDAVWPGGWTVLYGLDYFANDTAKAVTVAGSAINALGVGNVIFTIGNEPDGSARGLTFSAYLSQWQAYYNALKAAYPSIRIAAPDVANTLSDATNWMGSLASFIQGNSSYSVDSLTQHYYSGAPGQTFDQFLSSNARLKNLSIFGAAQSSLIGSSMRASEMNSVYSGGQAGISDALASVPWLIDSLILLETAGWRSATMHGLLVGSASYTPQSRNGDGTYGLKPVGYGMLLWDQIAGGQILPLTVVAAPDIKALAVLGADGKTRFLVCNKDPNSSRKIMIVQSGAWTSQQVLAVTGGSAASTSVTLGGAAIGSNGSWAGAAATVPKGTSIVLPAASAAVITLQ